MKVLAGQNQDHCLLDLSAVLPVRYQETSSALKEIALTSKLRKTLASGAGFVKWVGDRGWSCQFLVDAVSQWRIGTELEFEMEEKPMGPARYMACKCGSHLAPLGRQRLVGPSGLFERVCPIPEKGLRRIGARFSVCPFGHQEFTGLPFSWRFCILQM